MAQYVSDLGESIKRYHLILKQIREGTIAYWMSDDAMSQAKYQITLDVQSLFFRYDGKLDMDTYRMYQADGAIAEVEYGRIFVWLETLEDPSELEKFYVPSPGPDLEVIGYR